MFCAKVLKVRRVDVGGSVALCAFAIVFFAVHLWWML